MQEARADIWILTETATWAMPEPDFHSAHVPADPARAEDERWVSIWARWPLQPTGIAPWARGSLAVRCETLLGELVVYGTVLPWAHEGVFTERRAHAWEIHHQEIPRQGAEWALLAVENPAAGLVVAGDFNQSRDGSRWYGTRLGRRLLDGELERAGLACLTADDKVASGELAEHHLVDHICLAATWVAKHPIRVECWEAIDADGVRMSDHPGVLVELEVPPFL